MRIAPLAKTLVAMGAITLLLLEAGLWLVAPLADPYHSARFLNHYIRHDHEPNAKRTIVPEPGLPGMAGVSVWTTNSARFRGDELVSPKPANEYRIFMIGGSTTECLILDDADAIHSILQDATQDAIADSKLVKVYNAGISGDRTDDHVAVQTQRIVHMEPDMIIVFAGINDLRASIDEHDYLHYPTNARPAWRLAATQLQVGRLAYYVAKWQEPLLDTPGDEPIETWYRAGVEMQQQSPPASAPPEPTSTRTRQISARSPALPRARELISC